MTGRLFIIDLMPFLYRGHFVFLRNPRMTSTGINTSALIGFANGISAILKDFNPSHVVLAMDPEGPTFRHEAYPPYKQQREKMPEDLAASIPYAFELAEALNVPVVRKAGFEADDVMGTLSVLGNEAGLEVFLATPDKDAAQLVRPGVKLFRPGRSGDEPEIYDEEKVKAHWALSSPAQMIDYLALAGDASDNIPGIRGVGEKTAIQLLKDWGSIEGILAHATEIKGKLGEKIAAGSEDAKMSKFLTTIRTDVPLDVDLESFRLRAPDADKLARVCAKFELSRLAQRFLGTDAGAPAQVVYRTLETVEHDYRLVKTPDEARALVAILAASPRVAFDTETTGLDARTVRLVGMSFSIAPGRAWYVAIPKHRLASETAAQPCEDLFAAAAAAANEGFDEACAFVQLFAPVFAAPDRTLVAQNAKYDIQVLSRYGIVFGSTVHDVMLAHYVLDAASRHGMDFLAREYLAYDPIAIERVIGVKERGKVQRNMAECAPEEIRDYAAEDADVTLQLDAVLRPKVEEAGLSRVLVECEEPLVSILADMERTGVRIDTAALRDYGRELDAEIAQLSASIRQWGNAALNIDSPKQLGELLFDRLALDPLAKRTATGQWATDEKTLQKLVDVHPVVRDVLAYRACTKLKNTYVDKLPLCIDAQDGRVHTTFSQASTETGRLASSDPNLQNIPVRTDRGKAIRAAIVARDATHRLVSADYSQIELRIMAAMSGDESLLDAFANGCDVHRQTAARVYGVPADAVTADQRAHCKMVNFGIIYGISAFGLSQRLGVSRREAATLIDTYFTLYPKVRSFTEALIAKARKLGYAETLLGRRRTLRDIASRNATVRQAAERDAINTPVQGTAADLMKLAMVRVDRALRQAGLRTKMILQIHDELLFDAPVDEVDRVKALASREMAQALDLGVPLEVSVGSGVNWLEAH